MSQPCLVQLNCADGGSTGKIMQGIHQLALSEGFRSYTLCADGAAARTNPTENGLLVRHTAERGLYRKLNKCTGRYGLGFPLATKELLGYLDQLKPDVLQLHNLHHQFFDIGRLFGYIRQNHIRVVWTLHDCWAFTGRCPHFELSGCDRWRTGCHDCPTLGEYPVLYRDTTETQYRLKKQWFTGVENLSLVTPSHWLAGLVGQSFLHDYPVSVIHNGISLATFHPAPSALREKLGVQDKFVILCAASPWSRRKGLDVLQELAGLLPDSAVIVAVGPGPVTGGKGLIACGPVAGAEEMAAYYSMADVFFNPTREEVLGLVNLEALACGTPVVAFDTGGVPECFDQTCGVLLRQKTAAAAWAALAQIQAGSLAFAPEACARYAAGFDQRLVYREYLALYRQVMARP